MLTEWADLLGVPIDATDAIFDAGSAQSRTYMTQHGEPRVWADTYAVWLDRPVNASLSLTTANGSTVWEANLAEDVVRVGLPRARRPRLPRVLGLRYRARPRHLRRPRIARRLRPP